MHTHYGGNKKTTCEQLTNKILKWNESCRYFLCLSECKKSTWPLKHWSFVVHLSGWHNQCRSTSVVILSTGTTAVDSAQVLATKMTKGLAWARNLGITGCHEIIAYEESKASVREYHCLVKKKLWSVDKMKQTLQQIYTKCSSLYLSSVDSSTLTHFHVSLESVGPHVFEKGWSAAVGSNNNYTYNPISICKLVW